MVLFLAYWAECLQMFDLSLLWRGMKIRKAILPVAGFGTRFLPATKAQPKEMLPIFDTPAIQFIVEEAVAAGIEDIIMVTGRGKRAIEDHFDSNFELESALAEKRKGHQLAMIRNISSLANFVYVRQAQPLGDGHAILCASDLIADNEPVVVLFGDDLVDNGMGKNAVQQLIDVYEATQSPVVLLDEVPEQEVEKYGICEIEKRGNHTGKILSVVEKPPVDQAPSNLAVVGKFVLTPEVFSYLKTQGPGPDGEIRLTNAFKRYLSQGGELLGKTLEGKRFDTGDKLGFLKATLHYALQKESVEVTRQLQEFLEGEA